MSDSLAHARLREQIVILHAYEHSRSFLSICYVVRVNPVICNFVNAAALTVLTCILQLHEEPVTSSVG